VVVKTFSFLSPELRQSIENGPSQLWPGSVMQSAPFPLCNS
jgi:hypothetical protein